LAVCGYGAVHAFHRFAGRVDHTPRTSSAKPNRQLSVFSENPREKKRKINKQSGIGLARLGAFVSIRSVDHLVKAMRAGDEQPSQPYLCPVPKSTTR
jgi:hypothetical protein